MEAGLTSFDDGTMSVLIEMRDSVGSIASALEEEDPRGEGLVAALWAINRQLTRIADRFCQPACQVNK